MSAFIVTDRLPHENVQPNPCRLKLNPGSARDAIHSMPWIQWANKNISRVWKPVRFPWHHPGVVLC